MPPSIARVAATLIATVKRVLAELPGVEYASAMRDGQGLASLPLFPDYYLGPFAPETPSPATALPPPQRRPRLPRSAYPAIAERARHESLRDLAIAYDVSHETIRTIVWKTGRACGVATD